MTQVSWVILGYLLVLLRELDWGNCFGEKPYGGQVGIVINTHIGNWDIYITLGLNGAV